VAVREKCRESKVFFAGDAANKKKLHHVIKYITLFDLENNTLLTCELDSDSCVGTDEKTASALDISLHKIDSTAPNAPKTRLHGITTDAGGGGTGFGLERELHAIDRLAPDRLVVTCCLHAHSLSFKTPVEKSMLLGGNKKRTLLQLKMGVCRRGGGTIFEI